MKGSFYSSITKRYSMHLFIYLFILFSYLFILLYAKRSKEKKNITTTESMIGFSILSPLQRVYIFKLINLQWV